jgi:DNA polymerase elongation subunit (family B)
MPDYQVHIFDAMTKDQHVLRATEDEIEVEYVSEVDSDADSFYEGNSRKKNNKSSLENREMVIHLFGANADGQSIRIEVTGFKPFFYINLPEENTKYWKTKVEDIIKVKWPANKFQTELVYKQKLFGYTGGKQFPFLKLVVPSLGAFYETRKFFMSEHEIRRHKLNLIKLYESNIDPMLRFFHMRNLQPCGWIRVKGNEEESDDGLMKLTAEWEDISPSEAPKGVVTAPFHHAFWDIECYSHDGEFPMAQQGYRRVAKQLWANAETPEEVSALLQDAFQKAPGCPVTIPPLQHAAHPPKPKEIASVIQAKDFVENVKRLWGSREGLNLKEKEEKIQEFTKLLDRYFKRMAPIAGDPIIQIGTVCWKTGQPQGIKHIFVLGGCADVPGAVVHTAKTEKELILNWFEWCTEQNFDVFVGYNIFGFDEKYMWHRCCELGIEQEECVQALSRAIDLGSGVDLEEKMLSSSALGDNMLYMWTTPGRLRIDLFGHVKRKVQMGSYKLDAVAAAFLSGKLSGVVAGAKEGQWILKTKQKGDARIGRYVQILDELGEELSDKMAIVEIVADGLVVESEEELGMVASEAVKWAVVKDDVPPKEIFRLHRGSDEDRARVAAYCVQDCDLTLELYRKLEVFNEAMSMANVCSVPVSYIFTRGQGIKIESLIFKDCMTANQLIEVLPQAQKEAAAESYEGAIVLDPEPGFYTEAPVGVCDFASLYPSTIISENISHDMLVWVKDYDMKGNLVCVKYGSEEAELFAPPGTRFTDIEFDIWRPDPEDKRKNPVKIKDGIRLCRYAQPEGDVKGSLPVIVAKLLAARKAKRNEMAKTDDPFKKALLDAEQNAYKVTANSLYGQLGSSTFKIRLQHLAASVTSYGRKQIMFAKEAIEKFYGKGANHKHCCAETVYGDTDSIFICFNPRNPETGERYTGREAIVKTIELTEEAGKFITGALKAPHDFEYDKVFSPFIIFSKKRYVGNKYEDSPDEFKETSMGIVLKRRDNAPLLKMCYSAAVDRLLNHKDIPGAFACVKEKVKELVEGKMKLSQLTITKSLRAEYSASVTLPPHKMLADRIAARDPGNAPASGDRIGFVYIKPPVGQQASKLQGERVETPQYIQENDLKVDPEYYIEHQLFNPLSQLFGLMVEHLPGYIAPREWPADPDKKIGMREAIAGDLLFKDALNACRNITKREFMTKMFGGVTVNSTTTKKNLPLISAQVVKPAKQGTITDFFRDKSFIEDQRLAKDILKSKKSKKNNS